MKRSDIQTMARELLVARHVECDYIEYEEYARLAEKERRDLGGQGDPVNDPVNDGVNDGVNSLQEITPDMEAILSILKSDPNATQKAIGSITGFSSSKVERLFRKMKAEGLIKRIGPDKTGYWNII